MYTRREALPRSRQPFFLVEGGGHSDPARESFQDLQKQSAVPPRWISLHITCTHHAFKLPQAWSRSGWRRWRGESQAWSHRGWRRWRGESGCILRGPNGPGRAAFCYLATARKELLLSTISHSMKTTSRKLLYTPFVACNVPSWVFFCTAMQQPIYLAQLPWHVSYSGMPPLARKQSLPFAHANILQARLLRQHSSNSIIGHTKEGSPLKSPHIAGKSRSLLAQP